MGMKDEILKLLMDDLAAYYPPNIDGMESIEDIIKKSSNSDLQLRLIALKEFILKEKLTDANLYRPLYDDNFGDTELDIIEHYIKTDAKLDPEHAKVLNRIAELIGFKYTALPRSVNIPATQRVTNLTNPSIDMSINSSIVNQLTRYLAADINQQLAADINQQLLNYLASESQNDLQDPFSV
jgi:hypothetical protein